MTSDTSAWPLQTRGDGSPAMTAALAILVVALATIAGAWFFQLVVGLQPCPMCLEQRYAYYTIIPLSALVAISSIRGSPRGVLLFGLVLLGLIALASAVFGTYHAGVEWGFWQGPTSCTGSLPNFGSGGLLDQLDKVKVVPCDVVQWRFLGISLAGYNALISLLMAGIAAFGIRGIAKR